MQVRTRAEQEGEPGQRGTRRLSWVRLIWATAVAGLVAVASTALVFTIASAARLVDERVVLPSLVGSGSLSLASVSISAAAAVVAAGIVLGVLAVIARRPARTFRIVATALAALSLAGPATIPGAPVAMRLVLAGMHLVVWAVCVWLLTWLAGRRPGAAR
ncbi:MAG: hypothetical protein J2P38_06425 [Candidatus Dormibacteraeota bacterium]|nr:hypothetical protein [Candidatus Dormibacteraeota bacterium]